MTHKRIRFVKAHPAGIHEGKVVNLPVAKADQFINDGWAVDVDAPVEQLLKEPKATKATKAKK